MSNSLFSGKDTFNCSNVTGTGVTDMLPSQEYISFFKYTIENTCFKFKYNFTILLFLLYS